MGTRAPEVHVERAEAAASPAGEFVGGSHVLDVLREAIDAAARGTGPVLIVGETGTGKELVARALHARGGPPGRPFVTVNCAALAGELFESELFGHRKGAYTGAQDESLGLIRAAAGGSLFLDEVTEMPPQMQAKLLRVVEDHRVRPIGSLQEVETNVRFLASTNRDPQEAMEQGILRPDVYHRLAAFLIEVPPLRDHLEDVRALAEHFLQTFAAQGARRAEELEPAAAAVLQRYAWPGNVRELRNVIERALAVGRGPILTADSLPPRLVEGPFGAAPRALESRDIPTLAQAEAALIRQALAFTHGNKRRAATLLHISRHRLYDRLRRLSLN
jgi:two-component system, NtrC family, response regulator AtoC